MASQIPTENAVPVQRGSFDHIEQTAKETFQKHGISRTITYLTDGELSQNTSDDYYKLLHKYGKILGEDFYKNRSRKDINVPAFARLFGAYWERIKPYITESPKVSPSLSKLKLSSVKSFPNKAATIFHYGSAGSYFLSSLFDGHPEVLAFPFGIQRLPIYADTLDSGIPLSAWLGMMLAMPDHVGIEVIRDGFDEQVAINPALFLTTLVRITDTYKIPASSLLRPITIFQLVHIAYYNALGLKIPENPNMFIFQAHTPSVQRFRFAQKNFADSRIIFMMRNPYQALASHVLNTFNGHGLNAPNILLASLKMMAFEAEYVPGIPRERQIAIPLDGLKNAPEAGTRKIADTLDIEWWDGLLESTNNGKSFTYSSGERKVTGFSKSNLKRDYSDIFNSFDETRIKILFRANAKKWGYWDFDHCNDFISYWLSFAAFILPFRIEWRLLRHALAPAQTTPLSLRLRTWYVYYKTVHSLMLSKHKKSRNASYSETIMANILLADPEEDSI